MINCDLATQTVEQLLSTQDCDCDSHRLADNQDWCRHCGAAHWECCSADCPVGELDNRQAEMTVGSPEWLEIMR